MTSRFTLAAAALAGCLGAPEPASDLETGAVSLSGEPTCEHLAIGRLSVGCTATLVGERTLLTAAHCFDYESGKQPETFRVTPCSGPDRWLSTDRFRSLPYSITPPFGHADLAIVRLTERAAGVTPLRIADDAPWPFERVTTYGYGCDEIRNETGGGTKRKARVPWNWSFVSCPGDSGGPWLDDDDAIVGTTSWGRRPGVPVTDETGRPVRHRTELLRRMAGFERSAAFSCDDWADATGALANACLDEPDLDGACAETSDCASCCQPVVRGFGAAITSTCSSWGRRSGWSAPTCTGCGDAGVETADCWSCCDLGD